MCLPEAIMGTLGAIGADAGAGAFDAAGLAGTGAFGANLLGTTPALLTTSSLLPAGLLTALGGISDPKTKATLAGLGLLTQQPQGQMMAGGGSPQRPQPQPTPSAAEIMGNLYPQLRGPNINNGTMGIDPQLLQLLLGGR